MKPNFDQVISKSVIYSLLIMFWAAVLSFSVVAWQKYPGQGYMYIVFTAVSNLLLYFGFRKKAIFFDTFIGIFFWLGFWLKLSVRIVFSDGIFHEAVGFFDGTGVAFDKGVLVATTGLAGFLLASFLRERCIFNYPLKIGEPEQKGLYEWYKNHCKLVWIVFVSLIIIIALVNIFFGIYQRGVVTKTVLPFGMNGVIKWLVLFGLASVSAVIVRFEMERKRKIFFPVILLVLFESLISNVSMLSRGMILNGGSIFYALLASLKAYSLRAGFLLFSLAGICFAILFASSVYSVNYLRISTYDEAHAATQTEAQMKLITQNMTTPLFIDRWVGMEGVMAVSSYPNLGQDLWKLAWSERYDEHSSSLYDSKISSGYVTTGAENHFVSMPGIIAFFFYPGSYIFLFIATFLLGLLASLIEILTFRYGGKNLILCALIAQVVAYRYLSFGYVPAQSYLLFGAVFLNILMIYMSDKILSAWYKLK